MCKLHHNIQVCLNLLKFVEGKKYDKSLWKLLLFLHCSCRKTSAKISWKKASVTTYNHIEIKNGLYTSLYRNHKKSIPRWKKI